MRSSRLFPSAAAVLLLCLTPVMSQGQDLTLGRLFSTPAERAALDAARSELLADTGADLESSLGSDAETVAPIPDISLSLGGSVVRSNGRHTLWLNGDAVDEEDLPPGYRVVRQQFVTALEVKSDNRVAVIKPGQVLHLRSGRVSEPGLAEPAPVPAVEAQDISTSPGQVNAPASPTVLSVLTTLVEHL